MAMVHHHTRSQKMPHMHPDLTHNCMPRPRYCGSNCLIPCNCRNQTKAKAMGMVLVLEKELDCRRRRRRTMGNLVGCNCNWKCTKSPLPVY